MVGRCATNVLPVSYRFAVGRLAELHHVRDSRMAMLTDPFAKIGTGDGVGVATGTVRRICACWLSRAVYRTGIGSQAWPPRCASIVAAWWAKTIASVTVGIRCPVVARHDRWMAVRVGEGEDVCQQVYFTVAMVNDTCATGAVTTLIVVVINEDLGKA